MCVCVCVSVSHQTYTCMFRVCLVRACKSAPRSTARGWMLMFSSIVPSVVDKLVGVSQLWSIQKGLYSLTRSSRSVTLVQMKAVASCLSGANDPFSWLPAVQYATAGHACVYREHVGIIGHMVFALFVHVCFSKETPGGKF